MKKYKIIEVEWDDSCHDHGDWIPEDDAKEYIANPCYSVGYLLSKDKDIVRLVGNRCPNLHTTAASFIIPRKAITKITEFGVKE